MCIYFIAALVLLLVARYFCTKIASFDYKRLRSWSKEVWPWLCRGKDTFGGAFVIIASLVICWILGWNNKAFTVSGCALELAGMAQTTVSLVEVYQVIKRWIGEYPIFRYQNINGTIEANIDAIIGSLSGGPGVIKDDPNKSFDERIRNLYVNTKTLDAYTISYGQEIERLIISISALKSSVENELNKIKEERKQLHLGNFTPTLVGFAWIAAGTIMGTIGSLLS